MGIIDIHTHMLYGIDDGADNSEMSLTLMGMDYEQGVRGIFCTNHSYGMEDDYADYHRRFEKLSKVVAARYPGLTLYKGCEVMCYRKEMPETISNIRKDIYPTLNRTSYVLMEFDPYCTEGVEEMTYCLEYTLDKGYIPVIAHIERYLPIYGEALLERPEQLKEIVMRQREMGCLTQINLYSVAQDKGHISKGARKAMANLFLEEELVDFVGTDTHRMDYKSPEAAVGAAAIRKKYGDAYADRILWQNAEEKLIDDRL